MNAQSDGQLISENGISHAARTIGLWPRHCDIYQNHKTPHNVTYSAAHANALQPVLN